MNSKELLTFNIGTNITDHVLHRPQQTRAVKDHAIYGNVGYFSPVIHNTKLLLAVANT